MTINRGRGRSTSGRGSPNFDLSDKGSYLSLSTYQTSPRGSHKDKYAISLLSQPRSPHQLPIQFPPLPPTGPSYYRSPSQSPVHTFNTFSPLSTDSQSFKTIVSSRVSPHSKKQDQLAKSTQSSHMALLTPLPKINQPVYSYVNKPFFDRFFTMEHLFLEDHYFREPKKLADDYINPLFGRIPEDPDYISAWTRFFYGQNPGNSLSWFIYFDKNFQIDLPFWFLEWWDKFGHTIDFLPMTVKEGFAFWTANIERPDERDFYPELFLFYVQFNLTWILMLEYAIQDKTIGNVNVPYFGRQAKIKWWSGMNLANLTKDKISKWFSDNPSYYNQATDNTDQSSFLMAKSQNQARIAVTASPEELMKIDEEMNNSMASMSQVGSDKSNDKEESDNYAFDSEDPSSYFGHDP
ncbi:hypothetical protein Ddye_026685 [Dipteronia dyeriana]|uniref:Uncharacterized protein n=1 Tax=Dipteronia dyeriana TaxID=168575 RepID=A0AAD9TNP7_9ROSI|nr:hypothetical protein Ddye_026685 [Dipteronia dyeriana]